MDEVCSLLTSEPNSDAAEANDVFGHWPMLGNGDECVLLLVAFGLPDAQPNFGTGSPIREFIQPVKKQLRYKMCTGFMHSWIRNLVEEPTGKAGTPA